MEGTSVLGDLDDKAYLIRVDNLLQNWNLINSSNHRIFKCVNFMSTSHYVSAINLDVAPSFNVFNEFDYVFQSDVLLSFNLNCTHF